MQVKEESFKKRYFFKVLTNLIGVPISLVTQAIIPRGLGPSGYGNFTYLTNFFQQIISFFDAGSSAGFYTKLSQRQSEKGLIYFYILFSGVISVAIALFVAVCMLFNFNKGFWPGQYSGCIWMALIFALLTWYSQVILNIVDAYGLTVKGEMIRMAQKVFALLLILVLYWVNVFNLTAFFWYNYAILALLCVALYKILKDRGIYLVTKELSPKEIISRYTKEFYTYSAPLFTYSIIGALVNITDRWLLQVFGGSVQQGFYGLSYQIGAVCFIFTNAMTPLIMREYSIAFASNDREKMGRLFVRYVPMLYAIAAMISVFFSLQSHKVSLLMGGVKFADANTTVALMAFYPIHQTYGQLSSSVFFATNQTKLYRNIASITVILGLPITYFLVAPHNKFGLGLGSTGLAIKMIGVQLLSVNLQLWYNCKYLSLSFKKMVFHQLYSVGLFLLMGYFVVYVIDLYVHNFIISFLLSGSLYCIGILLLSVMAPSIFSTSREELHNYYSVCKNKLKFLYTK